MQYTSTVTPGEELVARRWTPSCGPTGGYSTSSHDRTNQMGRIAMLLVPNPAKKVRYRQICMKTAFGTH
jgi:hypothetical protein